MSGFDLSLNNHDVVFLKKELAALEKNIKRAAVSAGLREVTKPLVPEMKSGVAVRSGKLRRSIGVRAVGRKFKDKYNLDPQNPALAVGAVKKVGGYAQDYKARLIEHGVDAGRREVKRNLKGHRNHRADGLYTFYDYYSPGMRAQPFMKPAFGAHAGGAAGRFYQGLSNYLDRQRKKGRIL